MLLQASAEGSRIEGVGNLIGWGGGRQVITDYQNQKPRLSEKKQQRSRNTRRCQLSRPTAAAAAAAAAIVGSDRSSCICPQTDRWKGQTRL